MSLKLIADPKLLYHSQSEDAESRIQDNILTKHTDEASKDLIFRPVQLYAAADFSAVLGLCLHYCGGSFCRFIP